MPPVPPKMQILEFELEQKMNHHFSIEFHDESNGNSLEAQKLNHNTLIALIGPIYPINRLFSILSKNKKYTIILEQNFKTNPMAMISSP